MMEYLDIVRGQKDTHGREFIDQANKRVTTACCIRVADGYCQWNNGGGVENVTEYIFIGDSWFGSIPTAIA